MSDSKLSALRLRVAARDKWDATCGVVVKGGLRGIDWHNRGNLLALAKYALAIVVDGGREVQTRRCQGIEIESWKGEE
jgi:hypothetical protein